MRAVVVLLLVGGAGVAQAEPGPDELRARLDATRRERQRWERVLVEAERIKQPSQLDASVEETARQLEAEGRALTVEGLTMGVSSVFELASIVQKGKDWRTARSLMDVSVHVESAYKVFIEDLARPANAPPKADAELDKATAAMKDAARLAPLKKDREEIGALIALGSVLLKAASGELRGDTRTTEENYELVRDTLGGVRAMMAAFIQHRDPKKWVGIGRGVAKAFPRFGQVAQFLAKEGVVWANVLYSLSSAVVGGYVWNEAVGLRDLAADLRANRQVAAQMLAQLVPHARAARASALRREARLERLLRRQEGRPSALPAPPVSPRILDDGRGVPPRLYFGLKATLAVLESSPPVTYHLTKKEIRRREEIARAEREAAKERARAERVADERQQRDDSGSDRSRGSIDTSRVQSAIDRVVGNVLPNW